MADVMGVGFIGDLVEAAKGTNAAGSFSLGKADFGGLLGAGLKAGLSLTGLGPIAGFLGQALSADGKSGKGGLGGIGDAIGHALGGLADGVKGAIDSIGNAFGGKSSTSKGATAGKGDTSSKGSTAGKGDTGGKGNAGGKGDAGGKGGDSGGKGGPK